MRPEQNVYLVDGAQNINRMDGGYALKLPVDAIAEFRILTQSAPPEYRRHRRRDDQRRHAVGRQPVPRQPLRVRAQRRVRRAQLLLGGRRAARAAPVRRHDRRADRARTALFFFGYYEGFRNNQGIDDHARRCRPPRSGRAISRRLGVPLLNIAAGGVPFPGNRIPPAAINPVAQQRRQPVSARQRLAVDLPRDLVGTQPFRPGRRTRRRQRLVRGSDLRPLLVLGRLQHQPGVGARHRRARLPDPRRMAHALGLSCPSTHIFSPSLINSLRGTLPAPPVLLRSAPEPDSAERARLRLHIGQRRGPGAAVLQRQRLHADRRGDHRAAQLDAEHASKCRTACRGRTARTS